MGKLASQIIISTFLCAIFNYDLLHGEAVKEVLVRDRLVMVLCDQRDEYLQTGVLPQPVKIIPEKYKNFRPTGAGKGRSAGPAGPNAPLTNATVDGSGRKIYRFVNGASKTKENQLVQAEKDKDKQWKEKNSRSRRGANKPQETCDVLDLNDEFF